MVTKLTHQLCDFWLVQVDVNLQKFFAILGIGLIGQVIHSAAMILAEQVKFRWNRKVARNCFFSDWHGLDGIFIQMAPFRCVE